MKADHEAISRLLKTARGQVDGILKMVEEDQYCINISTQIMAAEAILRKANREIIRAHMESCVKEAFEQQDSRMQKEKVDEIVTLIEKLSK